MGSTQIAQNASAASVLLVVGGGVGFGGDGISSTLLPTEVPAGLRDRACRNLPRPPGIFEKKRLYVVE